MSINYVEANDRKELRKKINENDYAVIKKVCGCYACFDTNDDYKTWKNQK
jgi:hypothetical protein